MTTPERQLKVCLVSSLYPPRISGPSTQTKHFARLFRENDVTPLVITFGDRNEVQFDEGIKVYYLDDHQEPVVGPFSRYVNAFFRLRRILLQEKPDVLHYQTGVDYLAVISGVVAKQLGIPSLIKYAGDLVWERLGPNAGVKESYETIFTSSLQGRILTLLEQFALNNFTRVWATSPFQKDSLTRILKINDRKIVSYPNYISLDYSSPSVGSGKRVTILSVCRFARWKKIDYTLRAFSALKNRDVLLRIVGGENPEVDAELKSLAVQLGIEKRVEFVGSISPDQVNACFRDADIFVSSTTYEPFGITFVEAMAAALPVVATQTGGIPDVVPNGRAGYLVQPENIDEMTRRLDDLIDDPVLRHQFGSYGQSWAKRFDLRENLQTFIELYNEMKNPGNNRAKPLIKPLKDGLDKKVLFEYYEKQDQDESRMYSDQNRKHKQRRRLEVIQEMFGQFKLAGPMLDLGCGDGYAAAQIMNDTKPETIIGLDLSPVKLKHFAGRREGAVPVIGDCETLPFSDNSFSCVLCLETLEHILYPEKAVREISRVLCPGGFALISVPIDSPLQRKAIRAANMLRGGRSSGFNEHIQSFSVYIVEKLMSDNGLNILKKRFCGFNFPFSNMVLEKLPYQTYTNVDNVLCRAPVECISVEGTLPLALGREYIVLAAEKI